MKLLEKIDVGTPWQGFFAGDGIKFEEMQTREERTQLSTKLNQDRYSDKIKKQGTCYYRHKQVSNMFLLNKQASVMLL